MMAATFSTLQRGVDFMNLLYVLSAQAAIKKYHRFGALNRYLFLTVLEDGQPSSLLLDSSLLAVSSHGESTLVSLL